MTGATNIPAAAVSQRLLDVTGQALMTRNFEMFAPAFSVPTTVCSQNGTVVLDSLDAIRKAFERISDTLQKEGVTDLIRYCLAADYVTPDRIEATHESCQMRNNLRVIDPYPAFSVIERIAGAWKVTHSEYGFPENTSQARAFPGEGFLGRPPV